MSNDTWFDIGMPLDLQDACACGDMESLETVLMEICGVGGVDDPTSSDVVRGIRACILAVKRQAPVGGGHQRPGEAGGSRGGPEGGRPLLASGHSKAGHTYSLETRSSLPAARRGMAPLTKIAISAPPPGGLTLVGAIRSPSITLQGGQSSMGEARLQSLARAVISGGPSAAGIMSPQAGMSGKPKSGAI